MENNERDVLIDIDWIIRQLDAPEKAARNRYRGIEAIKYVAKRLRDKLAAPAEGDGAAYITGYMQGAHDYVNEVDPIDPVKLRATAEGAAIHDGYDRPTAASAAAKCVDNAMVRRIIASELPIDLYETSTSYAHRIVIAVLTAALGKQEGSGNG